MRRLVVSLVAGVTLLVVGAAGGAALAAGKLHILSKACVASASRAITAPSKGKCPKGSLLEQVGTSTPGKTGATGATGPTGPQGPQGPQGLPGTPATAKSYFVDWSAGATTPNHASLGVSLVGAPSASASTHQEQTTWHFPVDVSACGISATVVGHGFSYVEYDSPPGPLAQVTRLGDSTKLLVTTDWAGGSGNDFDLVVTCP